MVQHLFLVAAVPAALLSGPAGAQTGKPVKQTDAKIETAEKAYKEMAKKRRAAESTAEKLAFTKEFLDE